MRMRMSWRSSILRKKTFIFNTDCSFIVFSMSPVSTVAAIKNLDTKSYVVKLFIFLFLFL